MEFILIIIVALTIIPIYVYLERTYNYKCSMCGRLSLQKKHWVKSDCSTPVHKHYFVFICKYCGNREIKGYRIDAPYYLP